MSKSITQLKKWNLIAGGNDPKNDVIPANVCEGLEAALQIAITEILRLEARCKRLEEALGLVLKMRNDWLENQEDGYEGAYYAFVKGNDPEWEEIIKAKEDKL